MAKGLAEVLKFGRYEPLFRIGIGGMAEVYAARIRGEAGFQKQVAVKRMLPHLTGDQKFVDMFLDEARVAANVSSPNVVSTLDLGRAEDGSLYIVMELIVGVTFSQMLVHLTNQKDFIDLPLGVELLAQAAKGLDDAHEARAPNGDELKLVHRDVSPQNILVGKDGRVRMTDFGIAHAISLRRTNTQAGEVKGKFSYFSPEQADASGIDRRSDVFSLGVCGWELLTGRRLFRGSPIEAIDAVRHREIPSPAKLRPEIPSGVADVIMMALERDVDKRYQSAHAFATALRRAALAAWTEPPTSKEIGEFVVHVGGERLEKIRDAIANAGTPGAAAGTAVIAEPEKSHTEELLTGEEALISDEATMLLDTGSDPTMRSVGLSGVALAVTEHRSSPEMATAPGSRRRLGLVSTVIDMDAETQHQARPLTDQEDQEKSLVTTPLGVAVDEPASKVSRVLWVVSAILGLILAGTVIGLLAAGGGSDPAPIAAEPPSSSPLQATPAPSNASAATVPPATSMEAESTQARAGDPSGEAEPSGVEPALEADPEPSEPAADESSSSSEAERPRAQTPRMRPVVMRQEERPSAMTTPMSTTMTTPMTTPMSTSMNGLPSW